MVSRHRAEGVERRRHRIAVYLDSDELQRIRDGAAITRLAAGVYLRRVGLGYAPKSVLDAQRVQDVIRARGDLGRVGGLLKLWLADRPGDGASTKDVAALIDQIAVISEEIREKVRAL